MKTILDIFNQEHTYLSQYQTCCYQNCLRQVLAYYGVENAHLCINTVPDIYFIGEGQNYHLENKALPLISEFSGCLQAHMNMPGGFARVWEENLKNLEKGIPVIVCLDAFYLPYDQQYEKNHRSRWAILCGYLYQEKKVVLIDYSKGSSFSGAIPFDSYRRARESNNPMGESMLSGMAIYNSWSLIRPWEIPKLDPRSAVKNSLLRSLEFYDSKEERGIDAISRVFMRMFRQLEKQQDRVQRTLIYEYGYKMIYAYLYSYRSLYQLYLSTAWEVLKYKSIKKLSDSVHTGIEGWEKLLNLLFKASISVVAVANDRISNQLDRVLDHEKSLIGNINHILSEI